MSKNPLANKFIFNEKIDNEYIHSLYHDDYSYIAEIFQTTLEHFDGDLNSLKQAHSTGDITGLKRAVHKLKPVFGFTGLLDIQEHMNTFENFCLGIKDFNLVEEAYDKLLAEIEHSKSIIEEEHQRLTAFAATGI
jgi:chemotaxis protein histidine kinase CheA